MLDLDPIKARLAAATPGPWMVHPEYSRCLVSHADPTMSLLGLDVDDDPIVVEQADANLIASAPTSLAALVAEVERLRAIIELHKERITNKIGNEPWANYKLWETLNDEP